VTTGSQLQASEMMGVSSNGALAPRNLPTMAGVLVKLLQVA
jgi:hypothetical protein